MKNIAELKNHVYDIVGRWARASSPVRQMQVVSNKLFPNHQKARR